jgi:thiol-disulfide isomerase/thioredoxin
MKTLKSAALAALVFLTPGVCSAIEPGSQAPGLPVLEKEASGPLKGRVIYLDFWASWCGSCRRSFPFMAALKSRFGKRGLEILTVNVDEDRAAAADFLAAVKSDLPVVFDPEAKLAEAYDVKSMPSSYLIDAEGNVVAVYQGFGADEEADIEQDLTSLLGDPS